MSQPIIHTKRCVIREILPEDLEGMFELDSNPNVHLYIERKPVKTLEESSAIIQEIRKQYITAGICRWAVIEKETDTFIGWTGFRLNSDVLISNRENVFDLGYRFIESKWGKGFATETSMACMQYAFEHLDYDPIFGAADVKNEASNYILQKVGLEYIDSFNWDETPHHFYGVSKKDWLTKFGSNNYILKQESGQ